MIGREMMQLLKYTDILLCWFFYPHGPRSLIRNYTVIYGRILSYMHDTPVLHQAMDVIFPTNLDR